MFLLYCLHFVILPCLGNASVVWNLVDSSLGLLSNSTLQPSPRASAASWDASSSQMWLFGGEGTHHLTTGSELLNDLWVYFKHEREWQLMMDPSGKEGDFPSPRKDAVCCGVLGVIFVLHGGQGYNGTLYNDTWLYDMSTSTWLQLPNNFTQSTIPLRTNAASWCLHDRLYVYGGVNSNSDVMSEFWLLSLTNLTWQKLDKPHGVSPGEIYGASTWIFKDSLYMFGGVSQKGDNSGNNVYMWMYSIGRQEWSHVKHGGSAATAGLILESEYPSNRYGSLTWANSSGFLMLYGGRTTKHFSNGDNESILSDLWSFTVNTSMWSCLDMCKKNKNSQPIYHNVFEMFAKFHIYGGMKINPGSRYQSATWFANSSFYLFGGESYNVTTDSSELKSDEWYLVYSEPVAQNPKHAGMVLLTILLSMVAVGVLVCLVVCLKKVYDNYICPCQSSGNKFRSVRYTKLKDQTEINS